MNNLSLCFPTGADVETGFKAVVKGKGENPRKPQTMEIMKEQMFPQNSLLLSQQQPVCLPQTLTRSEEGHRLSSCISKRIVLAWSPREGTSPWSPVRLSWLYSQWSQNRPVRKTTLETLRKAIWIASHYEWGMQTVLSFPSLTICNKHLWGM